MQSLAGSWRVCNKMRQTTAPAADPAAPACDDADWLQVGLPAPWERFGIADRTADWWFRRRFQADPDAACVAVVGAPAETRVYLNGIQLPTRTDRDRIVLAEMAAARTDGEQLLALCVPDCSGPAARLGHVVLLSDSEAESFARMPLADRPARTSADWVRDAIIYEVYPRSFSPGGDLNGVTEQVPRLQELGTSVLWLMPIHPIGRLRRKGTLGCPYSIRDFNAVAPELGTLDDFRRLRDAAREHGMKLIIDLVANHTAWDHPWIKEHPDWYQRDARGEIRCPVDDWTDIAQLDYSRPDLRAAMLDTMRFWVHEVGIDGFRCDVAGMVPRDFWEEARDALDPDGATIMLAEDDDPAQHLKGFDVTYDWHLYDLLGAIGSTGLPAAQVRDLLTDENLLYPRNSLRMRFTTNHDKNAWDAPAITRYGNWARARLATALSYALPGVPLIYNGQELGNHNRLDLFEQVGFEHTYVHNAGFLIDMYAFLHEHRTAHPSFRRGSATLHVDPAAPHVLTIERTLDDDTTWTVLNLGPNAETPAQRPSGLDQATGVFYFQDDNHAPADDNAPSAAPEQVAPCSAWFGA